MFRTRGNKTHSRVHEKDRHDDGRDPLVAHNALPPAALVALHLDHVGGHRRNDQPGDDDTENWCHRVQQYFYVEHARLVLDLVAGDQTVE